MHRAGLHYIGGLDISFRSLESDDAVATLCVLSFPALKLLETFSESVKLGNPYVPSFLSFREAEPLCELLERYHKTGRVFPQILLVDGNGRLHERQCGSATAIGVLSGIPTIGIAKEYHSPSSDQPASHFRSSQKSFRNETNKLRKKGQWIGIPDDSCSYLLSGVSCPTFTRLNTSETVRQALKSSDSASRTIFVSSGHRIGLPASLSLALLSTKVGRVPEPIRLADQHSRQEILKLYGPAQPDQDRDLR